MIARPRALYLVLGLTPLLWLPAPAASAPPHQPPARAATAAPAPADNAIIPLPLTPVVPTGQRVCASRTPSGLGYTMLRPAAGAKPGATDTVLVNYIGYLAASGAVFDQGSRSPLSLDGVIQGFAQGLQMLGRTGVARLCIPAALGYGAQASGPIPANADLVFQIELLDFKTAAEIEALRAQQEGPAPAQKSTAPQP